jgi:hypothetical protein
MAKCKKHLWDDTPVDYCHLCEEETIKNYQFMAAAQFEFPDDTITTSVIVDLKLRADRGLQKYNTTLGENNHQNILQHAYEEALDMAQYLKKEITTLNTVQDLVKQYPNNIELGAKIRKIYG